MKRHIIKGIGLALVWTLSILSVNAKEVPVQGGKKSMPSPELKSTASGCLPGASFSELNIGNVRTRINSGGDMWWDFKDSQYEIPKGSSKTAMFAGALWIGGIDVNGQLKLAAQRYRQVGVDYFPGPLTVDGTAAISPDQCVEWDKMFKISRKEVDEFITWFANNDDVPGYVVPNVIKNYPAHGNNAELGQSYYLAPFYDANDDGVYNWENGDYPYYDVQDCLCHKPYPTLETVNGVVKGGILSDQVLKGDQTIWWVFNDKGNVHTETKGQSIGIEVRAQAFAFSTNDEINNMTFYSFEIINRSTYTLYQTYMSLWTDPDLGYHLDDYLGCDVLRGLGYCYNGKAVDGTGLPKHYGAQPPAIGIDFFQGPYMDPDGIDNGKFRKYVDGNGATIIENCNEAVNGVNFGNGIIDDERYGMRRFVYHNNSTAGVPEYMTDPEIAVEYYNFLRGIWKDNTKMMYGGNAHASSGAYGPECDFMFPDETDPCDWGTGLVPPAGAKKWTEQTAGNLPNDRRFMQSAGPFTLQPGALNYVTVGMPWARATTGGPFASVELLRKVDDKCQRLFDNCFRVVDGPDAPDVTYQELNKEIILYISNKSLSNNFNESYSEIDPSIVSPDSLDATERYDSTYRFEGYQIFQVSDATVTANDVYDADKARLVAQCDVKNNVSRLINYYYSEDLGASVPREEVNGENKGLVHSFRILEDEFATGDKRLVNNKKYYFIALAYGYNEYEKYSQDPANQIPGVASLYGQQKPYLAGRKNIQVYTVIPHIPAPEAAGTIANSVYGDGPKITRIEGQGNGGNVLDLVSSSINEIVANGRAFNITYENGKGPIDVNVIDPLNVKKAQYEIRFDTTASSVDTCKWIMYEYDEAGTLVAQYNSDKSINFVNEQIFVDLGLSVSISQSSIAGDVTQATNGFLEATMVYADSSKRWLTGIPDIDGPNVYNWIKSGNTDAEQSADDDYTPPTFVDPGGFYEKILGGTWAPYRLVSYNANHPVAASMGSFLSLVKMSNLASVDIVLTSDKSKWTRCPVIETCDDKLLAEGGAEKMSLRKHASVDKEGNPDNTGQGMGWFPGYAVNLETGERLNIIFGEDSWLAGENGNDMIFNPTANYQSSTGQVLFGGKHFVYVMAHTGSLPSDGTAYDGGAWLYSKLSTGVSLDKRQVYTTGMWVGIPMKVANQDWLSNDVKIRLRVMKPYAKNYGIDGAAAPVNKNYPMYKFNTFDIATTKGDLVTAKTALDLINVVPNPYYGYSGYETNQLDNRIKITNLPVKCTVTIYTVNGTMIRQYTKDDETTSIDWDLKNYANIPVSGGLYLIHVNAPGIGEKTIKWFGALRPVDLNSF